MTSARSITVELPSEGPALRELLDQVRSRSTLTADEALALANEELHAMRAEKAAGK